jgi:hypothetical protein
MESRCSLHSLSAAALFFLASPSIAAEPSAEDPFSGTYDVQGMTTDVKSGDTRRIEGHVVLTKKGDGWQAASELQTDFPTHGGPVHTDVIGTGDGTRKGDGLEGEAHTQLVIGTVPGVDTNFAFVPRTVGPRIVSKWKARLEKDGTLVVELTNTPEKGEEYAPTRTTLKGRRVEMPQEVAK